MPTDNAIAQAFKTTNASALTTVQIDLEPGYFYRITAVVDQTVGIGNTDKRGLYVASGKWVEWPSQLPLVAPEVKKITGLPGGKAHTQYMEPVEIYSEVGKIVSVIASIENDSVTGNRDDCLTIFGTKTKLV